MNLGTATMATHKQVSEKRRERLGAFAARDYKRERKEVGKEGEGVARAMIRLTGTGITYVRSIMGSHVRYRDHRHVQ